jgi:hypothetical protein
LGIGLRPDLTGRGLGESFLRTQLEYAVQRWQPASFRLFVAAWNERAPALRAPWVQHCGAEDAAVRE